jgi:hypothetical protein
VFIFFFEAETVRFSEQNQKSTCLIAVRPAQQVRNLNASCSETRTKREFPPQ